MDGLNMEVAESLPTLSVMIPYWCPSCSAQFHSKTPTKTLCPQCGQAELLVSVQTADVNSNSNPNANNNNNFPLLLPLENEITQIAIPEDPLPLLIDGVYYSSFDCHSHSLVNLLQNKNQSQNQNQIQGFIQKSISLSVSVSDSDSDIPSRFEIPPGQEFLQLIYDGSRRLLTEPERHHVHRLYMLLYCESAIELNNGSEIKHYPLSMENLKETRELLTDFLVQMTYYQCKFLARGVVRRALYWSENSAYHGISALEHHVEAKLNCSLCCRDFTLKQDFMPIPCKHRFHVGCFMKWTRRCGMCPVCNFNLTSDP